MIGPAEIEDLMLDYPEMFGAEPPPASETSAPLPATPLMHDHASLLSERVVETMTPILRASPAL